MRRLATIVSCLLLLPALLPAQQSAFPLYFEDNAGNRDTLYLGYDTAATDGIDTAFGEADIKDTTYDATFEVRLANLKEPPAYNFTFQTKTQIQYNRCDKVTKPPKWALHLRAEEWPVTVSWDSALFDTTCLRQSLLTARHPAEWFDGSGPPLFNMKDTGSITLSPTLHYYEADTGVGGDTIHLLFLSLAADSNFYRWPGILWDSVRADYFKKYQPADTPAWLFPLIFEEGNGQRDTIYLGFDSAGSQGVTTWEDTNFAEVLLERDTNRFQAAWYSCCKGDSIVRVSIEDYSISGYIRFFNGVLPLTIWWDVEALRSDRLPFPDQGPAPRAQGELSFDLFVEDEPYSSFCDSHWPILLTDTIDVWEWQCWRKDSVTFLPPGSWLLDLKVVPWQGFIVNIDEKEPTHTWKIYPNPVAKNQNIYIENDSQNEFKTIIRSVDGRFMKGGSYHGKKVTIDVSDLPAGIYLLELTDKNTKQVNKLIISAH